MRPAPLLTSLFLAAFSLAGCGDSLALSSDDASEAPTAAKGGAGGSNGSAGSGARAGSGGYGGGLLGGAAGASAGVGGAGSKSPAPSEACVACLQAICGLNCPAQGACDVCTVQPFSCGKGSSGPYNQCACEGGCAKLCAETPCNSLSGGNPANTGGSGQDHGGGSAGAAGDAGEFAGAGGSASPTAFAEQDCTNGSAEAPGGQVDCESESCLSACQDPCEKPVQIALGGGDKTLQGLWKGHSNAFNQKCAPSAKSGPDIVYEVTNTSGKDGVLTLELDSADDAILSLRETCGGLDKYCQNNLGKGGVEKLTLELKKDETRIVVAAAVKPDTDGAFTLKASLDVPVCGDKKVSPGEECDGQDGCSDDCKVTACADAPAALVNVPKTKDASKQSTVLSPSCAKPGTDTEEYVYSFRSDTDGWAQAILRSKAKQDLVLSLWSGCGKEGVELGCSDAASGAIDAPERLVLPVKAGQQIFAVVSPYGQEPVGDFELYLGAFSAECGDLKANPNEQCDSSDPACEGDCTLSLAGAAGKKEGEPNADAGQATWAGEISPEAPLSMHGKIAPAGDVDWFAVDIKAPGSLVIETHGPGDDSSCQADFSGNTEGFLDNELSLLSTDGLVLATSDNSDKTGLCARLTASVEKGKYFVRTKASPSAPSQRFSYVLEATLSSGAQQ